MAQPIGPTLANGASRVIQRSVAVGPAMLDRVRVPLYRRWLGIRYGERLIMDPSAVVRGRIELAPGARLSLGPGSTVDDLLQIWGSVHVDVGRSSTFLLGVRLYGRGTITIGERVVLNATKVNCLQSVIIGDDSLIGASFITDTDFHNLSPRVRRSTPRPEVTEPVTIGRNVWVGYGAIVLKGCRVGDDSVLSAGAVVRRDVPDGVVVSGNPAVIVRTFEALERSNQSVPPLNGAEPSGISGTGASPR